MSMSRFFAAGLAAMLAAPALAQSGAGDAAGRAAGREPATQAPGAPATAPAPAPGQPGPVVQGAEGGVAQPLTQEQRKAIGEVVALNDLAARVGDLATTRATTPALQNVGRSIADDHRRIQIELGRFLADRGVQSVAALPPAGEKQRLDAEFMRLAGLSGPEFDQELVTFLTRNGPQFVESLKRARDVTPGKDAQLKKYLDDAENVEEAHLRAAREVKTERRQARTPPRQ